MVSDPFLQGLRVLLSRKGAPQPAVLSRQAGLSDSAIRKLLAGNAKSPKLSTALSIAQALGMNVEDIVALADGELPPRPAVPIVGTVGAGAKVPVFEVYEPGGGPAVSCPPGLSPNGMVAVEVEGDSMEPIYFSGDLLFYTRECEEGVPSEAIGRTCVCEDNDGMGWVKQVKRGSEPGLFHLISLNPSAENMHDIKLKWASPVRLHWPAELARKL